MWEDKSLPPRVTLHHCKWEPQRHGPSLPLLKCVKKKYDPSSTGKVTFGVFFSLTDVSIYPNGLRVDLANKPVSDGGILGVALVVGLKWLGDRLDGNLPVYAFGCGTFLLCYSDSLLAQTALWICQAGLHGSILGDVPNSGQKWPHMPSVWPSF